MKLQRKKVFSFSYIDKLMINHKTGGEECTAAAAAPAELNLVSYRKGHNLCRVQVVRDRATGPS